VSRHQLRLPRPSHVWLQGFKSVNFIFGLLITFAGSMLVLLFLMLVAMLLKEGKLVRPRGLGSGKMGSADVGSYDGSPCLDTS
jgi:hypothetical protein